MNAYAKVIEHAESAIHTVAVTELVNGDIVLVPGKGKRAVRAHTNGKLSLVFPKSGKPEVDGRKAGTFSDFDGHAPAVIGRVEGGWATDETPAKQAPRKAAPKPKASRKAAPKAPQSSDHLRNALAALGTAIEELTLAIG